MRRSCAPITAIAGLVISGVIAAGCASAGASTPAPSAGGVADPSAARRPTLVFTITGGPGAGKYVSDPASTLDLCVHASDGSWRVMYGGGDPWTNVDLLFGARVAEPGGAEDVAAEITAGQAYLWMDQRQFHGGDAKGRSSAIVAVTTDATATTFHVTGRTPNRTPAGDGVTSTLDLTVICPA